MPTNATGANRATHPVSEGTDALTPNDIAVLAYALWVERGCPEGSPDEDWIHAEEVIKVLCH
jgi:hypothetical protein